MACVRQRRGRWVCDYRDHLGIRRAPSFRTRDLANAKLAEVLAESGKTEVRKIHPEITVAEYASSWLAGLRGAVEASTIDQYERTLRLYVAKAIGGVKVRKLRRAEVKTLLTDELARGRSRDTVRLIHSNLRTMMNAARDDDELIRRNPCEGLGRLLRLAKKKGSKTEDVRAFDRAQLDHLLATCQAKDATLYPIVLAMVATGMRPQEARALQWDNVDLGRQEIRVERAESKGVIKKPKSGHGRTVHMWPLLGTALVENMRVRYMRRGQNELVFPATAGERGRPGGGIIDHSSLGRRFRRLLRKAKLPKHYSPKSLRHSYASILLAEGESPAYVQEQLGHASITLTVDTYGRWLRKAPRAAAPVAAETLAVANSGDLVTGSLQVGDPARTRTLNPEIKSIKRAPPERHSQTSTDVSDGKITCEDFDPESFSG